MGEDLIHPRVAHPITMQDVRLAAGEGELSAVSTPPSPETYDSEVHKDRTGRHGSEVA